MSHAFRKRVSEIEKNCKILIYKLFDLMYDSELKFISFVFKKTAAVRLIKSAVKSTVFPLRCGGVGV